MSTVMAGDIGGTSSRFMLYEVSPHDKVHQGYRPPGKLVFSRIYPNEYVATFCDQVSSFLKDAGIVDPPAAACIAVAGPVTHNKVDMTNRNWIVDGSEVEEKFNIPVVRLVNDFVAAGYGLLTLDVESECITLQAGERSQGDPIACIGSGTGLGETFLTCPVDGCVYDAWPTEGGHAEMSPRDDLEYNFVKYMKRTQNITRVSVERVASGTGLTNVYDFLSETFPERVDKAVDDAIKSAGDLKGKIISQNSAVPDSICKQVMEMWATHYGAEAGAMALRSIPTGGLFLAGGMTPKNLSVLEGANSPFMKAFHDKGRVSGVLKTVPIYAVLAEDIGLRGSHFVAARLYVSQQQENTKKYDLLKMLAFSATTVVAVAAMSATIGVAVARAASRNK